MSPFLTLVRRSLLLLLLAAIGGSIYAWLRDRSIATAPDAPEWPPLDSTKATTRPEPTAAADEAAAAAAPQRPTTASGAARSGSSGGAASVVNELIDAPEARSDAGGTWVAPSDDGSCPDGYPIKANDNSGIFHVPGGRFYERTKAERCYASAEAAIADGYRQAKS